MKRDAFWEENAPSHIVSSDTVGKERRGLVKTHMMLQCRSHTHHAASTFAILILMMPCKTKGLISSHVLEATFFLGTFRIWDAAKDTPFQIGAVTVLSDVRFSQGKAQSPVSSSVSKTLVQFISAKRQTLKSSKLQIQHWHFSAGAPDCGASETRTESGLAVSAHTRSDVETR
jgi:hypothetical protein